MLILNAVKKIKLAGGDIKIKELTKDLPLSRDPFEKRFRREIGTSPKQFSSVIRIKTFINNYTKSEYLTKAALKAGYYDQAHFIKDFKLFTGKTPRDFLKSSSYW
jgi:transcriptional regulator GlxA family with amidase domain